MSSTPTYSTHTYLNRQQKQEATRHLRQFGKVREKNDLPLHIKLAFFHKAAQYSLTFKLYMISIFLVSYIVFSRFGSLTCGDAVSGSRLWPAGPLPPADVWPPAGPAAPDGSCGRSRPGGSQLEESERRNLFRCNRH